MEDKFFTKVAILLLPPLFSQVNFKNNGIVFLELNEIIDFNKDLDKKPFSRYFVERMNEDFSEQVIKLINREIEKHENSGLKELNIILVNYPMNKNQLVLLEKKFGSSGIEISKIIVSNSLSFEILLKVKSKYFICPACFKSYDKETNYSDDQYLCPFDQKRFTFSQINDFSNFFMEYYLQNSLEVIQNFVDNEEEQKNRKIKMFPLSIESEDNIEEALRKSLVDIIRNN